MLTYPDRAPRLDLSFPLVFTAADGEVAGHCLNLSESGLLGIFDQPLELWTEGSLLLHFGDDQLVIGARIARMDGNEAGLSFQFRHPGEREAVHAAVAFASHGTHLIGKPPF